jgi:long-subunit acyl-CoA synthetase (AMP-forming)
VQFVDILQKVGFTDITIHKLEALNLMIISVVRSSPLMSAGGRQQAEFTENVFSNVAYVITTSGTTGIPKIVRVPHQCIIPNIVHIRYVSITANENLINICLRLVMHFYRLVLCYFAACI